MWKSFCISIGVLICAAVISWSAKDARAATQCVVAAGTEAATISADGRKNVIIQPNDAHPQVVSDCTSLRVTTGRVCVLTSEASAGCFLLTSADELGVPKAVLAAGSQSGIGSAILFILTGERGAVHGGMKMDETVALPGFPYNDLLPNRRELVFPLAAVHATAFDLSDEDLGRHVPFSLHDGNAHVAGAALAAGHGYTWTAVIGGKAIKGRFGIDTPDDAADALREADQAEHQPTLAQNAAARTVARAMVLDSYHYGFDRDLTLAEVGPRR